MQNFLEDSKLTANFHENFNEKWEVLLGKTMTVKNFEQKLTLYF